MNKLLFFLLFTVAVPLSAQALTLNLDQCVQRGLELNPQVQSYRIGIEEADEEVNEAWGAFLPTLSASYTHSRLENNRDTGFDRDYLSQDTDSTQVRLSQPLFSGMGGIAGLKRARHSKEYRQFELQFMQQQLVREIRTSFYDVLRARQLVEKWQESVTRLDSQQEIAKAWVDQELAPQLRLLEVAVELSTARQNLVSVKTDLIEAEASLEEWLVLQPEEAFDIDGAFDSDALVACETLDACLEMALNYYPTLQMAQLNIEMAHEEARMIRARNLPKASFDASWTDFKRDYDSSSDLVNDEEREYYTLAVNLSFSPFQGGKNIFAYRKQNLRAKRLGHELSTQKNSVAAEVKMRFQQLEEGEGLLDNALKRVEEATEAYNITDRSARLGVSSLDDLLTAEIRLTQAEIGKINAEHGLQQAQVLLDFVVGAQYASVSAN
ncbi:MAG: TolC family protein [Desulfuromonadales bacterium]|nr:TolC family protein [Desulfuromonadales bacterium]